MFIPAESCVFFLAMVIGLDVGEIRQSACADPESFVRGGPTLTTFFFYLIVF